MAIPDFVVNKVSNTELRTDYPALIELSSLNIEVYEPDILEEMKVVTEMLLKSVKKEIIETYGPHLSICFEKQNADKCCL